MSRTTVSRTIQAPVERVFDTVAHVDRFAEVVPEITKVEFLSDARSGVGTRFRETRRMGKRDVSTVLEVTEYVENDRVRLKSDVGGAVWDSVFTVRPAGDGATELTLVLDANAYKFGAKLITPLIKSFVRKGIERDLDAVKAHCER